MIAIFLITSLFLLLISSRCGAAPYTFNWSQYEAINPQLPTAIQRRMSGDDCGGWRQQYQQAHAAARSAPTTAAEWTSAQTTALHPSNQQGAIKSFGGATLPDALLLVLGRGGGGSGDQQHQQHQQTKVQSPATQAVNRYAVMVSYESGLADRLTCSLSVFLYALLTNRTFEYVWYGHHELWASLASPYIDWRAPPGPHTLNGMTVEGNDYRLWPPKVVTVPMSEPVTENYHAAVAGRSKTVAHFYQHGPSAYRAHKKVRKLFSEGNLVEYGSQYDVVMWTLNQGHLAAAFGNPTAQQRLQELGLRWEAAVPCLFNYLYVPTPAALAPFAAAGLLDKLLKPNAFVIGVQIRVGDFYAWGGGQHNTPGPDEWFPFFHCAQQLTVQWQRRQAASELVGGQVHWLLVSDSSVVRGGARSWLASWLQQGSQLSRRYGRWQGVVDEWPFPDGLIAEQAEAEAGERLLVAGDIPLDHVQDFAAHGQAGLHAAAGELWLFGLASAHVVTRESSFGRLGAMGGAAPLRAYGVDPGRGLRPCRLEKPDPLGTISSWFIGMK